MSFCYFRAMSAGVRHAVLDVFKETPHQKYKKHLLLSNPGASGRKGKIVCRNRGAGHKRLYRKVDFKYNTSYESGCIRRVAYDPNRTSRIALVCYKNGVKIAYKYILAPHGVFVGINIITGFRVPLKLGNSIPLWNIPLISSVYNLELYPGRGGSVARARGTSASVLNRQNGLVLMRIPSGEFRRISQLCWRTIGTTYSGETQSHLWRYPLQTKRGKAGCMRWLGRRPTVRGSAINPVDHPHGGGEGRRPIGRVQPCTPWGKPRLGLKTRSSKTYNAAFFLRN